MHASSIAPLFSNFQAGPVRPPLHSVGPPPFPLPWAVATSQMLSRIDEGDDDKAMFISSKFGSC